MSRAVLILLLVSNVVLGTTGYLLLRQVDRDYTALLESSLPLLDTVRALSWQLVRVQRAVNRLPDAQGAARDELLRRQVQDMDDAGVLLGKVVASPGTVAVGASEAELRAVHTAYMTAISDWRALIGSARPEDAAALVVERVRPAYDAYEGRLDKLGEAVHDAGMTGSQRLSAEVRYLGGGLAVVGAWPLWLAGVVVLFVGVLVFAIAVLVRGRTRGLA